MSRTFSDAAQAVEFGERMDREITDGVLQQRLEALRNESLVPTLSDAITHYINMPEIKAKKSIRSMQAKANVISQHEIASMKITAIKPSSIVKYREDRSLDAAPGTVSNELALMSRVFAYYIEHDVIETNPCAIRRPRSTGGRTRRLEGDEEERLFEAARGYKNPEVVDILTLSLETGMRIREILGLERRHINLKDGTAFLPDAKTGSRHVPLSNEAIAVLKKRLDSSSAERVFSLSYDGYRYCWKQITRQAGIDYHDLKIHDLRHELISRLFERDNMLVMEAAVVSGHKNHKMLDKYTHLKAEKVRTKLNRPEKEVEIEKPASSIEARLKKLKDLLEAGLIPKEAYDAKLNALMAEL